MLEFASTLPSLSDSARLQHSGQSISTQRIDCLICGYQLDPNDESKYVTFSCNVRAFKEQSFRVWQCPQCITVHCLDRVDLTHYYARYPFTQAKLTRPLRLCYRNLRHQLTKHGFSRTHSLLDYGCGSGLFVQHLRESGFVNCHGYDPYACESGFGNPAILNRQFDYILLQDVIEHIEDPNALLHTLNQYLAPGGYILIGTPNAANIDLTQPERSDYYNPVHVPYHLHLYTRESLEMLGFCQGWQPVDFCDRPYHDTLWFSLNSRAWNEYQRLCDRSIDVVFEPINIWKALTSYKFLFYAMFGYWLSLKTEMTILFHKPGA